MSPLSKLLNHFRQKSETEREKGTYFERLVVFFLKNDSLYGSQFSEVFTYNEWVNKYKGVFPNLTGNDEGIDIVAKPVDEDDKFVAIQCKFYDSQHQIRKSDVDSFIAASTNPCFSRRILVDSTSVGLHDNAERHLENSNIDFTRITIKDLEDSSINWDLYDPERNDNKAVFKPSYKLKPHQEEALDAVCNGLQTVDRGKLIMACGTGKTLTSLRIAEKLFGLGKRVLFLVPSLSLMSQTIKEWNKHNELVLRCLAVCSDGQVGKTRSSDDITAIDKSDLAFRVTTDAAILSKKAYCSTDEMLVIFSTYHSLDVISKAQIKHDMPEFDFIICDEAHRTTGVKLKSDDGSIFIKIHDQSFVRGKKRLYMTATPRIFVSEVKEKAKERDAILACMDNEEQYGKALYTLTFTEAVEKGLLSDYKVIILTIDEDKVAQDIQERLCRNSNLELTLDETAKIIGCYRALGKFDLSYNHKKDQRKGSEEDGMEGIFENDKIKPMKRAIAFCRSIKYSKEQLKPTFSHVVKEYANIIDENIVEEDEGDISNFDCEVDHIDGTMPSNRRHDLLNWLSEEKDNTCRILSNVRCLSEGVDVPTLDAVIFLHPKKSLIDVVQAVGRVMRKADNKEMGYVILPVGIPAGAEIDEVLDDNERYGVIWDVLNSLRAHDEGFDADINKIGLGESSKKIEIVSKINILRSKSHKDRDNQSDDGQDDRINVEEIGGYKKHFQSKFHFDSVQKAIRSKIIKKCGQRAYWEDWAVDVAEIAQNHINKIKDKLKEGGLEHAIFNEFLKSLRHSINEGITEDDAIEMLAQHIITKPVFDSLFSGYNFTEHNPVSKSMQIIIGMLHSFDLKTDSESLKKFYRSVELKVRNINTSEGRQKIILELYDKFFRRAFPRTADKLGIVYTPVEIVDFIIHSVNDVLKEEFGSSIGAENVNILDPFTGTGTFLTRFLQSDLISKEALDQKYDGSTHANEILLLAYYIAAINIESVYHDITERDITKGEYKPFGGICFTDTFKSSKEGVPLSKIFPDNDAKRGKQDKCPIQVIVGNPPYSVGQGSANDNNQNMSYPELDESIENSYVKYSEAVAKMSLYDSYIKAIRWATNRVGEWGIVGFITNAGFITSSVASGMRKCLAEDFSKIYIYNLRGNSRVASELSKKEGGNVFDIRTPVAICIFVKKPKFKGDEEMRGELEDGIYYYEASDYLKKAEKLAQIKGYGSIISVTKKQLWKTIVPDKYNDWLNQRDDSFNSFICIGDKKDKNEMVIFENYSRGIATGRDSWVYNYSKRELERNVQNMIDFYNSELERYKEYKLSNDKGEIEVKDFVNNDTTKISWSVDLHSALKNLKKYSYDRTCLRKCSYRPFSKQNICFNKNLNERVYQMPKIFPEEGIDNLVISVSGVGAQAGFSVFMYNCLMNHHPLSSQQCFPLKLYEKTKSGDLFSDDRNNTEHRVGKYTVKDGITDAALNHFREAYPDISITKEDIFYYIYGILHSEDYRSRYANNFSKQLPRIPRVKTSRDFLLFSRAGRELGELHVNYDNVKPYPVGYAHGLRLEDLKPEDYRVTKMKFATNGGVKDKSTVIYNSKITMTGIPLEAYDYIVNGKPALDWVRTLQVVLEDKDSGIENDANDWANEVMGNPKYPLELFQRVITVSLETIRIVRSLPKLDIL